MKKLLVLSALLVLVVLPTSAARNRVAVFGITVHSENPEYKHIGKGFSELISEELRKSPGITVVNRRKLLDFLEKMNLTLPELDNLKVAVLVSKMLKADYMILGEINDAENGVKISLQMIEGVSGEVVWREELTESLSNYEFISTSFARLILVHLDAKIPKSTTAKAKSKTGIDEDAMEEAMVAFSTAVDALDRKDNRQAKIALIRAAEMNPDSEAIEIYMQKAEWSIEIMSPKFRIETEFFTPAYNPASLGFIDHDSFYTWVVQDLPSPDELDFGQQLVDGYYVREISTTPARIGYVAPLGQSLGLGVEFVTGGHDRNLRAPVWFAYQGTPKQEIGSLFGFDGGAVSLGYRFREDMSVGVSLAAWYTSESNGEEWNYMLDRGISYAFQGAYMLRTLDQRLAFDFSVAYTNQAERYVDFSQLLVKEGALPLLIEASLSSAFLNRTLVLSLTGLSDIYIDGRGGYVLRAIPVVEYWPFRFLAVRAGCEYSHMDQIGELSVGYGGLAGVSFKFWRIELNGNFTIREKPTRLLPGHSVSDWTLLLGVTLNTSLVER